MIKKGLVLETSPPTISHHPLYEERETEEEEEETEEEETEETEETEKEEHITKLFSRLLCDPDRTKYKGVEVCKAWDNSSKKRLDLLVEKKSSKFRISSSQYLDSFPCLKDTVSIDLLLSDFEKIIVGLVHANILIDTEASDYDD
ncbi:hypothetical protein TKK_0002991 [Trichogramma kaykai]